MISPAPLLPAVFVSSRNALGSAPGGVQTFTREQIAVLQAAGFSLTIIPYDIDNRFLTRLRRRLRPQPYSNLLPPALADEVVVAQRETKSRFVFLNSTDLTPLAVPLRQRVLKDEARIVLLSVGLESVDYLHAVRARRKPSKHNALTLGRQLFTEAAQRRAIDRVVCLAPFEAEIERWLGSADVGWLPRTVPLQPLDWQPDPTRLGCVSTVDHPPNA